MFEGPSALERKYGRRENIVRLVANVCDPDHRKIHICYRSISAQRIFLFPWMADRSIDGWEMTATLIQSDRTVFKAHVESWLDFHRSVEIVINQVIRNAVIEKLHRNHMCLTG